MRELFRDFFNKLFFRNDRESKPVPKRIEHQNFTVFGREYLTTAIDSIKDAGWTVTTLVYDKDFTEILAYREVS